MKCPNCGNKRLTKEVAEGKIQYDTFVCRLCDVIFDKEGKILSRNASYELADDFVKSVLGV